jgi:ribosome-associated heat shock protein Hsp15
MRDDRQRLDKWLWFARFAKSRTLAAKLVQSGFVRVNGRRAEDPAKALAVGDVVTIALGRTTAVVRVEALGERRGPAPQARLLYADLNAGSDAGQGRDDPPLASGEPGR